MKTKNFVIAGAFLAITVSLVLYDRYAEKKRSTEDASDRELLVEGVSESHVNKFIYSLAHDKADKAEKTETAKSEGGDSQSDSASNHALVIEATRADKNRDTGTATDSTNTPSWQITSPLNFPANNQTISKLLEAFLSYRYDEYFPAAHQQVAQFGLFPQTSTALQVWTSAEEVKYQNYTYLVGKKSPVGFKMYMSTSFHPGHVYFGPRSSVMNQQRTLKDFLNLSLPRLSFEVGDSISLTLHTAESKSSQKPFFSETFTRSTPSSTKGSDQKKQSGLITLKENPQKSDLVSIESLNALVEITQSLKAVGLGYAVNKPEDKQAIAGATDRLEVSFSGSGSNDSDTLSIYRHGSKYYAKKGSEFLLLEGDDISAYFDLSLESFLIHPLPLALTQKALKKITLISHRHEANDPGYQKDYKLMEGKWTALSDQTKHNNDAGEQEGFSELDLEKPPEMVSDITKFVEDLYGTHYHIESAKGPSGEYELLYTVSLHSSSLKDTWELHVSNDDNEMVWLKKVGGANGNNGTKNFYFIRGPLVIQLMNTEFGELGETNKLDSSEAAVDNSKADASGDPFDKEVAPSSAEFNKNRAVNLRENLNPLSSSKSSESSETESSEKAEKEGSSAP